MRAGFAIAAAVLFFLVACGCRRGAGLKADAGSPSGGAPAASSTASAVARTAERASDPRWLRARDGDAMALTRLADAAGASELLEGVDDGGEVRRTALLALPLADDAEIALGRLADAAMAADPASAHDILVALLGIAHRRPEQREPLDLEGARRSGELLLTLAARSELPIEDRALAVSAARALAEKGYLDPARIP